MEAEIERLKKLIKITQPMNLAEKIPDKKEINQKAELELIPWEKPEIKTEPNASTSKNPEETTKETIPTKMETDEEIEDVKQIGPDFPPPEPVEPPKIENPEEPEPKTEEERPPPSKKTKAYDPVIQPPAKKVTGFGLVSRQELAALKRPTGQKRKTMIEEDETESVSDKPVSFLLLC